MELNGDGCGIWNVLQGGTNYNAVYESTVNCYTVNRKTNEKITITIKTGTETTKRELRRKTRSTEVEGKLEKQNKENMTRRWNRKKQINKINRKESNEVRELNKGYFMILFAVLK